MPNVIEEIEEELKKIPEGPWYVGGDDAEDCRPHKDSGLALVDTGRSEDWTIARLCEWGPARFIAKSPERMKALMDYVRAAEEWFLESEEINHLDLDSDLHKARVALGLQED